MSKLFRKIILFTVCALLVLAYSFPVFAYEKDEAVATSKTTLYGASNGVPTGEANAICQDRTGYIWIGGYGGLQRYDGVTFTSYSDADGLTSSSIRSLFVDSKGKVWVGSNDKGAFFLSNGEFHNADYSGVSGLRSVRCFAEDKNGRIWIGCGDGLAYIKDKSVKRIDLKPSGFDNSTIYTLSIDVRGILWAVDYSGSLIGLDTANDKVKYSFRPGDLWDKDVYAYSAKSASDGSIYVGTNGSEIIHINNPWGKADTEKYTADSLTSINTICETSDGRIFLAGDAGIGVIENGKYSDCTYIDYASYIVNIMEDYEHNIWAASSKYGVIKVSDSNAGALTEVPELDDKETFAVLRTAERSYVGYEDGLLILDSKWHQIEEGIKNQLKGKKIRDIAEGSDKRIYLASYYDGVYVLTPGSNSLKMIKTEGKPRTLLTLSDGSIAVGTDMGLEIIKDDTIVSNVDCGIMVLCLVELKDGTVLCGTDGNGILSVTDGRLNTYADTKSGLSGGIILRMRLDSKDEGKLWVSCGKDVFHGNSEGFKPLPRLTLGSGSVLEIIEQDDMVWLFRSGGILGIKRSKLLKNKKLNAENIDVFLNVNDGIPGPVTANSFSSLDGNIFSVCTVNGVGVFDTDNLYENEVKPRATVSDIEFSDGSKWNGRDEVNLDPDLSRFTIYFSALSFMDDDAYAEYYLEGFDDQPIIKEIKEQNEVEYTNLEAGNYTFHLCALNGDGVKGPEQTIHFIKKPKFTETPWFIISIAAAAAALVWLIGQARLRTAQRKQAQYKEMTDQTITTITGAIDAKDPYTQGHSQRVAEYSVKIAKKMGLSEEDCERLRYIALLHDVGKIGVPDNILKKPGKLTDEEYAEIKQHTVAGGEILKNLSMLPGASEGALYHHERYDGTGYCSGISGEQIPLFARIISVADSYDAMNSSRCYRKPLDKEVIIAEIENGKGKQFDPEIAEIAVEMIRNEEMVSQK